MSSKGFLLNASYEKMAAGSTLGFELTNERSTFTFTLFATSAALFLVLVLAVALWGQFLDRYEHNTARVRRALLGLWFVTTSAELGLWGYGFVQTWVMAVALVANLWGGLDAILRFPVAHKPESTFVVKQVMLLLAKTMSYTMGLVIFKRSLITFTAVLMLDICAPAVAFCMSIPFETHEKLRGDDCANVDIVLQLWRLAASSRRRQQCLRTCKGWMQHCLSEVSEASPILKVMVCAASPELRRRLHKAGRSI